MGNLVHLHGDAHEQTLKLLPWYLNGTLDEAEAAMVEAHLVECASCSREAEGESALRNGVTSLANDVDHGWAAMRQKLETAEAPPPRRTPVWRRRVGLGWAGAGALAASVTAVALASLQPHSPDNVYHALGAAPVPSTGNAIVLFSPDTSSQVMRDALAGVGARITDGPLASGGYMLHLPPSERGRRLEQLRAKSGVVMAEPIDAPQGP
jgi:anti-sigma factor RsiW